jgi:hypothetical protein
MDKDGHGSVDECLHRKILIDLSATPNLEANETDNCSEANHMVLDIFVVMSNKRIAHLINED